MTREPTIAPRRRRSHKVAEPRDIAVQRIDQERLSEYRVHRRKVGEALMRSVMRALATLDAAATVNSILEGRFDLGDVRLDTGEIQAIASNVLRMEVLQTLLESGTMSKRERDQFIDRFTARILPTRDNLSPAPVIQRMEPERAENLERIMRREMARAVKGNTPPEGR